MASHKKTSLSSLPKSSFGVERKSLSIFASSDSEIVENIMTTRTTEALKPKYVNLLCYLPREETSHAT